MIVHLLAVVQFSMHLCDNFESKQQDLDVEWTTWFGMVNGCPDSTVQRSHIYLWADYLGFDSWPDLNCRIEDWQVRVGMRIGRLNVHTLLPTMWSLSWVSHILVPAARWIPKIPLWLTKIRWVIIGTLNKLQIPAQTTFSGTQAKPSASWKTWYKNILWLIPQEAGNI